MPAKRVNTVQDVIWGNKSVENNARLLPPPRGPNSSDPEWNELVDAVQDPTIGHGHTGAAGDGKLISSGLNSYPFTGQSGWSIPPNVTVTAGPYNVPNNGNKFLVMVVATATGVGNGGGLQFQFVGGSSLVAAYSASSSPINEVYNPNGAIRCNMTTLGGTVNASVVQILVAALDLGK